MDISEKGIRNLGILAILVILAVLVFILIKPILLSLIAGLLLAYVFMPVYNRLRRYVKEKNTAAAIVTVGVLAIIIIPLWFIVPLVAQQSFEVFKYFQTFDIKTTIGSFFPTASEQFLSQTTVALNSFVAKIASGAVNTLIAIFLELPTIILHTLLIFFVFFFGLRDKDKLKEFFSGLSPFSKLKERQLVRQFRDITDTIVYGQVVIGIVQGTLAGIGFLVFGVPNAFVLTGLALIFSIIPIIGPAIVWAPVAVYLFFTESTLLLILFIVYNVLIVSSSDNVLRLYMVSKKAQLSTVVVLVGMIAGLFIFGILGLILGPLILVYFIEFLKAYREKNWDTLFSR
jgi:predicted PurR-regulated permease PerM